MINLEKVFNKRVEEIINRPVLNSVDKEVLQGLVNFWREKGHSASAYRLEDNASLIKLAKEYFAKKKGYKPTEAVETAITDIMCSLCISKYGRKN